MAILPFAHRRSRAPREPWTSEGSLAAGDSPFMTARAQKQFDELSPLLSAQGRGFALDRFWTSHFQFPPGPRQPRGARHGFEFAFISRNGHVLWRKTEGRRHGGSSDNVVYTRVRGGARGPHHGESLFSIFCADLRRAITIPGPPFRLPLPMEVRPLTCSAEWENGWVKVRTPAGVLRCFPPATEVARLREALEDEWMTDVQLSVGERELSPGGPYDRTPIEDVLRADRPTAGPGPLGQPIQPMPLPGGPAVPGDDSDESGPGDAP